MKIGDWYKSVNKGGQSVHLVKLVEQKGEKWVMDLYSNGHCCCPPRPAGKLVGPERIELPLKPENVKDSLLSEEEVEEYFKMEVVTEELIAEREK